MTEHILHPVIVSDNPRAIFGFYGPYKSTQEAVHYYNLMSPKDPSCQIVHWTRAQMNARITLKTIPKSDPDHQSAKPLGSC